MRSPRLTPCVLARLAHATSGGRLGIFDPDAAAVHRAVSERSRGLVLQPLLGTPASAALADTGPDLEMTWVVLRGVLQGLALWWVDHPEVQRERVVATALGALWSGWGSALGIP